MKRTEKNKKRDSEPPPRFTAFSTVSRSWRKIYGIFLWFKGIFFRNSKLYAFDYHNKTRQEILNSELRLKKIKFCKIFNEIFLNRKIKQFARDENHRDISAWVSIISHKHKNLSFTLFHCRHSGRPFQSPKTCLCFRFQFFFIHQLFQHSTFFASLFFGTSRVFQF